MSAGSSSLIAGAATRARSVVYDIEVRDLGQRVDAGVGAARSVQLEFLAPGRRADGAIDLALHRPGVLLDLPAAVSRAGVLDRSLKRGIRQRSRCSARMTVVTSRRGVSRSAWTPILFVRPGITRRRPAIMASYPSRATAPESISPS